MDEVPEDLLNHNRSTDRISELFGAMKQLSLKSMDEQNFKNCKQEQTSNNKLEHAFEICLSCLLGEVWSVTDCLNYLADRSILEKKYVQSIQSKETEMERKKLLLLHLTKERKLHTLYEIVKKPGFRDHIRNVAADLPEGDQLPEIYPPGLTECRNNIIDAIFLGSEEWRLEILADCLLPKFNPTTDLLDHLTKLSILKEQDRCDLAANRTAENLFKILRERKDCALFSLLTYLNDHGGIPGLWDQLTDEYRKAEQHRLEKAFEVSLPLLLTEMCSPLDCADHLIAKGILDSTEKILAENTRLGGVKQLLYQLLEKRNLHTLYGIFDEKNVKEEHIKEKIYKNLTILFERNFSSISEISPEVRHWKLKTAEMSLFGEESLHIDLREYFCSNVDITDELLTKIAVLGLITETDLRSMRCTKTQPKGYLSKALFYTLLEAKNGSLFSMLSFLHSKKLYPRLWEELAERYEETLRNNRGAGNVDLKTSAQFETFKECYNVERIRSTPGALQEADAIFQALDARLKGIKPGCVTFSLQFKSVKGLLQCWLEYLDGRLSEKLSEWAGKLIAGDMSAKNSTPECVNIKVTQDMFLKTLLTLINPEQWTLQEQGGETDKRACAGKDLTEHVLFFDPTEIAETKAERLLQLAEMELGRENLTSETVQWIIQRDCLQRCDRLYKEMWEIGEELCRRVENDLTARTPTGHEQGILMKNYLDIRNINDELKVTRRVLRVDRELPVMCEKWEKKIEEAVQITVTSSGRDGVSGLRDILYECKDISRAWMFFSVMVKKTNFDKIHLGEDICRLTKDYPKELKGLVKRWAHLAQRIAEVIETSPHAKSEEALTDNEAVVNHEEFEILTTLGKDMIKTVKLIARHVHINLALQFQSLHTKRWLMHTDGSKSATWLGKICALIGFCETQLNASPRESVRMSWRDFLFSMKNMAFYVERLCTDKDLVKERESLREIGQAIRRGIPLRNMPYTEYDDWFAKYSPFGTRTDDHKDDDWFAEYSPFSIRTGVYKYDDWFGTRTGVYKYGPGKVADVKSPHSDDSGIKKLPLDKPKPVTSVLVLFSDPGQSDSGESKPK